MSQKAAAGEAWFGGSADSRARALRHRFGRDPSTAKAASQRNASAIFRVGLLTRGTSNHLLSSLLCLLVRRTVCPLPLWCSHVLMVTGDMIRHQTHPTQPNHTIHPSITFYETRPAPHTAVCSALSTWWLQTTLASRTVSVSPHQTNPCDLIVRHKH